jgi:LmbE family N-acetylglucosaminyl deacetylase
MENWFVPHYSSKLPAAKRVLVFAPHPDDEVFGCAGAIVQFCEANSSLGVLIFTDGCAYLEGEDRSAMKALRQRESELAAKALGCPPPVFLGFEDRRLNQVQNLKDLIYKKIEEFEPDLLLIPSLWEIHPDHRALCFNCLSVAIDLYEKKAIDLLVMQYEVGATLKPNFILDISSIQHLKAEAMLAFGSQLLNKSYDRCIKGLNEYRTLTISQDATQAEAYILLSAKEISSWLSESSPSEASTLVFSLDNALVQAYEECENLRQSLLQLKTKVDRAKEAQESTPVIDFQSSQSQALMNEIQYHRELVELMQKSWSWRLTWPLRFVGYWFRKIGSRK